ncbi:DUF3784 domain-containing protein [Lysinibacillus sp. NPDC056959]|uniref:DUF3784 domain-containing protein n=1 Tax=Lysinibacillus sp. NPDC056959 TaxID=3345981 RepID=UPI00363ABDE6
MPQQIARKILQRIQTQHYHFIKNCCRPSSNLLSMKIETRYGESIVRFIIMFPFLIFAIVLSQGKGAFFLEGYNTMPASEKEK